MRRARGSVADRSAARCIGSPSPSKLHYAVVELRPVPRLEREAERIAPAIRHSKPESSRIVLEPEESLRVFEFFRQRPAARRRDVDRLARMVLAVAGRRIDAED